ncbi:Protein FdhD homolog [[Clostridium] ultunense Esp]|uniref:Sulfur carrier protein FdhD n=1 Tax=[Clostridium] ultunense Esp TaxID=1288971 RepID=M1ZCJ9_9FIRM|nr:formate dehydrogenase accessory sulfurtransferase FdhD [Schnuerera ultunensis]CCQ96206.1 Protein FdhD homolog [[Clostridium] ultunense Esp]SHD78186.1 Formate dehydrogenase, subunit FdhD [[Clostridium] ultunense Esp]
MDTIKKVDILRIKGEEFKGEEDVVILEYPFTIFVNDEEIITLLCSPNSLKELMVGFLFSEEFISSLSDIDRIRLDEDKGIGYIYLKNINQFNEKLRGKRTITSGCGKGTLFYNVLDSFKSKRIKEPLSIEVENIKRLISKFNKKSELFLNTGGVHSCALCSANDIILFEEDIGRHNALDKIFGKALLEGIDTKDKIILTSGRISSEILIKSAKRQVPVIVSRSAPTSLSIELAEELGITLIGFARGQKMNIYTNFPSLIF